MKPVVILCDATERSDLESWFKQHLIETKPTQVESGFMNLEALQILSDDLKNIALCGSVFAYENDKIFQARVDTGSDEGVVAEEVTEDNIAHLMANNNEDHLFLLFEDKED